MDCAKDGEQLSFPQRSPGFSKYMKELASVLFGAVFTVGVSAALGALLLQWMKVVLRRTEAALLGWVLGSGCLSFITALLCVAHAARKGVFLWAGLVVIAVALGHYRAQPRREGLSAISLSLAIPFYVIFGCFFFYYLMTALAPEVSADGSSYHLGNVLRMWHGHGFDWEYHSMYSYLSQGLEMLFLVAFCFGKHSSAALVHFAFFCTLPLLMVCWGCRFGYPKVGVFAALLVFASPVMAKSGSSAYNDLAVATIIYSVFYLLQLWDESREFNLLYLIGLLAGFAYGIKYTAFLALPFALGWVCWRGGVGRTRQLFALGLLAGLMMSPWIVRNWIWVGNPFAPFGNAWFPNPYYHPGMERMYTESLRHYRDIKSYWEIPLQLTMRGGIVEGLFGPTFLLAPTALIALRFKYGRRLLAALLVFALPAYLNVGARFLIPSLPFLAMAMGIGLAELPGALAVVGLFHLVVCWPPVLSTYCDPWAWRISQCPVRVALRLDPAQPYIESELSDVSLKSVIESKVPIGERVFSFTGRPQAYIERDIVVSYESTLGNLVNDILWAPQAHPPKFEQSYKFMPVRTRAVRVLNIANEVGDEMWTVAEMRVRSQNKELKRAPGWRISAWPNGWEAPLAFDNSYATRWSAWERLGSGEWLRVDFPIAEQLDEVVLECDPTWKAHIQVEVLLQTGRWVPITDSSQMSQGDFPTGLRKAAARDVKAMGIRFLLVNEGDLVYEDIHRYGSYWGVEQLAEKSGTHFYRID
jgi:hypothetical protein